MKLLPTIPGFMNPLTRFLEDRSLIQRRLVGQFEVLHDVDFDLLNEGDLIRHDGERVVFFLFEFPSGRRTYEVFSYGQAEEMEVHVEYLPEVMRWVHGGEMPSHPVKAEPPKPVVKPFTVLLGGVKS